jgi:hypothetical protein
VSPGSGGALPSDADRTIADRDARLVEWHEQYDSPGSALARRLDVVQHELRRALTEGPTDPDGTRRLISMCAGAGGTCCRCWPIIPAGAAVRALLVELDPTLSDRARETAADLGLTTVSVRTADAGTSIPYRASFPAHVLLACGVFGNVTVDDAERDHRRHARVCWPTTAS